MFSKRVSPQTMMCLSRLCSGASCTQKNLDGKTAMEVAELNQQDDIKALFEKDNSIL